MSEAKARPQFSLSALLLSVAAVGVVLALMFQLPFVTAVRTLLILVPVSSAFAITGLVYGPSLMRTFCIGALVPLAMMVVFITIHLDEFPYWSGFNAGYMGMAVILNPVSPRLFGGGLLASITLGYLCVAFRWLIDRPHHD